MASSVNPIPSGFHSVTPYLTVNNSVQALEFYAQAFGAKTISVMPGPNGATMHAEMRIGDSIVMLNDEFPQWGVKSPLSYGGTPVSLHIYLDDADADRFLVQASTEAYQEDVDALTWIQETVERETEPFEELSFGPDRPGIAMRKILLKLANAEAQQEAAPDNARPPLAAVAQTAGAAA